MNRLKEVPRFSDKAMTIERSYDNAKVIDSIKIVEVSDPRSIPLIRSLHRLNFSSYYELIIVCRRTEVYFYGDDALCREIYKYFKPLGAVAGLSNFNNLRVEYVRIKYVSDPEDFIRKCLDLSKRF